jgi:methionyl aminopeptidase
VCCHGIPDGYVLKDGDIINVDVTAYIDGVHGDGSETFAVGNIDEKSSALIQV